MKTKSEKPFRLCVGIALINSENKIFVGKRIDLSQGISKEIKDPQRFWQMPQGGVDKNENFFQAAKRELEEETGVKSVKLIKEIDGWLEYDLPDHLSNKLWNGKYRGQKQKWFIMKFTGNNDEINIKTVNPEFSDWKWIEFSKLQSVVVYFKTHIYKRIEQDLNSLNLI